MNRLTNEREVKYNMNSIQKTETKSWLTSKLRQQVEVALLLDISSSMCRRMGADNIRKIDNLRIVAEKLNFRKIVFHSFAEESWDIPEPKGSTAMHLAFNLAKSQGIKKVVLITDGEPDSAGMALESAKGLEVDIIYIGDGEPPLFLSDLTNTTGGKFQQAEMTTSNLSLIENTVIALIEGGESSVINS